ncbi:MAG: BMP family ABC transporter substrate-binding protein [Oscillospiraceae bacterium]|nr:BMP family ABC transporter substrate-binding protein [Oscillospiraceae bacterium]
MKKLTALLLALLLTLVLPVAFVGCDDTNGEDGETTPATTTPTEPTEEPHIPRVGFIFSGTIAGSSHNRMWDDARTTVERQLGVETFYVENVFVSNFDEAVAMLADSMEVDVIVSTSHFFATPAEAAATERRNIVFISHGGTTSSTNLATFQPLLFEPAHMAGFAAAHNIAGGVTSLGVVTDMRMYNVYGVINAFISGANSSFVRGIPAVHVRYVNSRSEAEVREAVNQLRSQGVDTVMTYLDTEYGATYANSVGLKVVAYANNPERLAANNYIAGFYFDVNLYLTEQLSFVQTNSIQPRNLYGAMASGHIKLTSFNTDTDIVAAETLPLVSEIQKRVVDRRSPIFADEHKDNFGTIQVQNGVSLTHQDVLKMNWLMYNVGSNIENLAVPGNPAIVPLRVVASPNNNSGGENAA